MSSRKVAVVTGSNKGIGFATVRGLAKQFDGDVFLTAPDIKKGEDAVNALKGEGIIVKFHQLDILDKNSINKLGQYMTQNYGGVDILVNNAGIAFNGNVTEPMSVQAELTIATNYFGTKDVCEVFLPLLRDGARVVNVSSSAGFLPKINGQEPQAGELRKKFVSSDSRLMIDEVSQLMHDFIESTKEGNHSELGWPNSTYVVSKVGIGALTRIQQREFNKMPDRDIVVNHVHPGYVATDMNNHKGPLTIDEGAKSSLYAALLPPKTDIKGKYIWFTCENVDWVNGPLP